MIKTLVSYMGNASCVVGALLCMMSVNAEVVITPISYAEFTAVFDYANSKPQASGTETPVWYVQYQAGDDINSDPQSHELEIGDLTGLSDEDELNWSSLDVFDYSIIIDGVGNIDATFGSSSVTDAQTGAFNKIYFGLYVNNESDLENIQITHNYESQSVSGLIGERTLPDHFIGFVLEDSSKPINIADFNLQGQITLNMVETAFDEEWSYTIVGVNDPPAPVSNPSTTAVTESEFDTAFADMEFYVEIRAGSNGSPGSHEFEIGTSLGSSYLGETSWVNNSENSFTVDLSDTGFLSVTVNSTITPSGNQPRITNPFNEIWIGLSLNTGLDLDALSITNHEYDGASIDNPSLLDGDAGAWYGFKLIDDQKLGNIADFTISGDLIPEMHFGAAGGGVEGWTYVVFGKYNPDLVATAPVAPKLTAFNYDKTAGTLTFTWDSTPSATYSINYTEDLTTDFSGVLNASIPSGGASTTHGPVANPVPSATKLFFKVSENAP